MSDVDSACESPSVTASTKHLARTIRDWLAGVTALATLEVRYSVEAVMGALLATLVLGAILFSSWCLVLATIAMAVVQMGWEWIPALLLINALNLLFAVFIWRRMHVLIERVGLDSTCRALGLSDASDKRQHGASDSDESAHTHPRA